MSSNPPDKPVRASLKTLAEYLDLSPTTISLVINDAPLSKSIPAHTRERVHAAAKKFNYHPSFSARSLRTQKTYSVGVIVPEMSDGYCTGLMSGVEETLMQAGYMYFTVSHFGKLDLVAEHPRLLLQRSVDGMLLIDTQLQEQPSVPVVLIEHESPFNGVTSILLDNRKVAELALHHLYELGHRKIVLMRGGGTCLDAQERWRHYVGVAQELGLEIPPERAITTAPDAWTPDAGYPIVRELLERTRDFTAILAFNDMAAIGAMRAIHEAGLRCPEDISVVGVDDIGIAAFQQPALTTVRQPLRHMGEIAAQQLINRMKQKDLDHPARFVITPELVLRRSTAPVRQT